MSKECAATSSVLLVVKSYTNYKEGVSFPSIETITEKSGFSRRSVIRALQVLTEMGYLECKKSGRKNIYTVHEKFELEHRDTGDSVEVSAPYVPKMVERMREELKEFISTGQTKGQYINITIPIQIVHGGTGNQNVSADYLGMQIEETGKAQGKLQAAVDEVRKGKKKAIPQ